MRLKPFTGEVTEPLGKATAKAFLKVDDTADDALIEDTVRAAREHIESSTGKLLVSRSLTGVLDAWPCTPNGAWFDGVQEGPVSFSQGTVDFPVRPVTAITSVVTYDAARTPTTWGSTNYYLDTSGAVQRLVRKPGLIWPITLCDIAGIEITFVAGFATVPSDLMQALKILVGHWYQHRDFAIIEHISTEIALGLERILKRHRPVRL